MKTVGLRRGAALVALIMGGVAACDTPATAPRQLQVTRSSDVIVATGSPEIRAGRDQVCEWYPSSGTIQCQKGWNYGLGAYGGVNFNQYVASYTDRNIVGLVMGPYNMCALLSTGNTKCWGEGAPDIDYTGGDAVSVSLTRGSACVVTRDGTVKCLSTETSLGIYGSKLPTWTVEYAQSGVDPTKGNPVPYTGKALWIVAGAQYHCFQTDANPDPSTLSCLGSTYAHQFGALNENDYPRYKFNGTPLPVAANTGYSICVLMKEGNVDCIPIYYNDNGINGPVSGPRTSTPALNATDLSGTGGSTCVATASGDMKCWGATDGVQSYVGYNSPFTISGRHAVKVARTAEDLCWLDSGGDVRCLRQGGGAVIGTAPAPSDATPPVITPTITGTLGSNGWYTSDVAVSWNVSDPDSPVSSSTGCSLSNITSDTDGADFTCSATSDGGPNSAKVTIMRDATPPTVTYTGNAGSYTVDQSVAISCSASDATNPGSGLASTTCKDIDGDAYTFAIGSNSYSATATDNAGNTGSGSAAFGVSVTSAGLCALTTRWTTNAGIANSLCVKLQHAASHSGGAAGDLKNYLNEVSAQSGKAIPADKAAILSALAADLN